MSAPRFFMGKSRPNTQGNSSASSSRSGAGTSNRPPVIEGPGADDEDSNIPEYSSPADVCPVCKTDRFLNPKLRLMVSSCYHKMCESCMDRIFSLGPEPCPVCHTTIRKAHFKPQRFEDLGVQKELAVRRKMARTFNKQESDFVSPQAYNAYLEEVESWTFKLLHELDVEETERNIRKYLEENADSIESNAERGEAEKLALKEREEQEKREKEEAKRRYEELDEEERKAKEEERRAVLEALESSSAPAESIIRTIRSSALKRSTARLAAPVTSLGPSGLRSFSGLRDPNSTAESDDAADQTSAWDSYEYLYDILPRVGAAGGSAKRYDEDLGLGTEQERPDEGGFRVEEVWEKAVRASLGGLWVVPLLDDDDGDVQMSGA